MKIMYYELIKMLIAYEKPNSVSQEDCKNELSGRLQKYLNQRFLEDVQYLKRRTSLSPSQQLDNSSIITRNTSEETEVSQNISLERRLQKLEENQLKLQKSNQELKDANKLLIEKLSTSLKFGQHDKDYQVSIYCLFLTYKIVYFSFN